MQSVQPSYRVLALDDETEIREGYLKILGAHQQKQRARADNLFTPKESDQPDGPKTDSFDVSVVDQGEAGIDLARQALAEGKPFMVALVDMRMPPGIDGLETAKALRKLDHRIYIVFVTAFSDKSLDEIDLELKQKTFLLRKPFVSEEIFQLARSLTRSWCQERELEILHEKLEGTLDSVMESMGESVLVSNSAGKLLFVNAAATLLLGRTADAIIAKPPDAIVEILGRNVGEAESLSTGEMVVKHPDDGEIPVIYSCRGWGGNHSKRRSGRVLVLGDLRERKREEDRQRYAAFQSGVAEMSINVLHNIGNALQGVSMHADIMRKETGKLLKTADTIANLQRVSDERLSQGERLEQVFQDLMMALAQGGMWLKKRLEEGVSNNAGKIDMAIQHVIEVIRIQQGASRAGETPVRFQMRALMDDVVILLENIHRKHDVTIETDLEEIWVTLPRNQLLQSLINLIKNGLEAIIERRNNNAAERVAGHIQIESRSDNNNMIEIVVRDNGVGIPRERLQKIFNHGYSTKDRGSGYGLHAIANFIQSQKGTIQVMSDGENLGAQFLIRLPIVTDCHRSSPIVTN